MLYLHNILGGVWFVEENFAANYFPLIASFLTKPEAPVRFFRTRADRG